MALTKTGEKVRFQPQFLRVWSKGQLTIPARIRKTLNIKDGSILSLSLNGNRLILTPVKLAKEEALPGREYSDDEIRQFLKEDKIDKRTLARVKKLLG